jgi:hypothetical protein
VRIGFCTTCMNRAWQLKLTLPDNLALAREADFFISLVNFNSGDDADEFVRGHFPDDIAAGRLVYFHTPQPEYFHASKAKNLAHRVALRLRPDILFSLDADGYVTRTTVAMTEAVFGDAEQSVLHNWTGSFDDGSYGRIAMTSQVWTAVGGYNELGPPIQGEDTDLIRRAMMGGARYVRARFGMRSAIRNTIADKVQNLELSERFANMEWPDVLAKLDQENIDRYQELRGLEVRLDQQRRYSGTLNFTQPLEI